MSTKTYLTILRWGIYFSFLSLFFVFKGLLFPFITSKQIYFNILIGILFVFWVALIARYSEIRPKKSWISIGLIIFFSALIVSSVLGVDFNLSFWGDVERMLGVFHLLHFLVFYFIIITVFRTKRDWMNLLRASVVIAVLMSIYGILSPTPYYGTIGNTAYVSGYLIFNIFFAAILFSRTDNAFKFLYLPAAALMFWWFTLANATGAHVGLLAGCFVGLVISVFLGKSKKIKIVGLAAICLLSIFLVVIFLNKESGFVRNNRFFQGITEFSFAKNTFQTRLISWKAAVFDFPNHPFFGTGYGNFAITFDKYFDPKFYIQTPTETYFDRAHNNLIDIASTAGIAGILSYLLFFAAAVFYLIVHYRKGKIELKEFALLSSLLTAYFTQNLAVFDSIATYIPLMITLGYIYGRGRDEENKEEDKDGAEISNREIYSFALVGLFIVFVLYQCNIKPLRMLVGVIDGQRFLAQKDILNAFETHKNAMGHNTVLDRDGRSAFINAISSNSFLMEKLDEEKAREIYDYAIRLAEDNVKYNEADSLSQLSLAQILNEAAGFNSVDPQKFVYYSDRALEAVNKSIAASPGRVRIYFVKAQIYLTRGDKENALKTLQYAVSLEKDYIESSCQLARAYIYYGDEEKGYGTMGECLDGGGAGSLSSAVQVKSLINYYADKRDWNKLKTLYERLVYFEGNAAQTWINLAQIYETVGDKEKAVEAATRAAELDPSLKPAADEFINKLK